ncbi:MAG: energy-coupling factor transporter transmembrane protein EcfT [Clostridia bacterium]|nr:energy-coupling factor transporter transmembrane protein EcfT [Clostridia bacterium]
MQEFKRCHPVVNFTYFALVIVFSCSLMHPICLGISLCAALILTLKTEEKVKRIRMILSLIPLLLLTAVINPLFNHEGMTVLAYFPNGNPLTLESLYYGLSAGVMLLTVILHFAHYNQVMTSDKFLYLFGKVMSSLSLVLSMVLRFIPNLKEQLDAVQMGQRCIHKASDKTNVFARIKKGIHTMGILTTWALEHSIHTADSMKSRGYGMGKRTAYSHLKFDGRDARLLLWIFFLGTYIFIGWLMGSMQMQYFPLIEMAEGNGYHASVFISYFLLCMTPAILEQQEARKWKQSISRD